MYAGLLIKESLSDERILDFVDIKNVDIWVTDKKPRYWTAISFVSNCMEFPEKLSKALREIILPLTFTIVDLKYSGGFICAVATFAAIQEDSYIRTGN